jgi:hypothetical protein
VSGIIGQKASLGQANGSEVELIVSGTALYATYETLDGFPAIYDEDLGLFCYARVVAGKYQSTGVPVTSPPPPDVDQHAKESEEVRAAKILERQAQMERRSQNPLRKD